VLVTTASCRASTCAGSDSRSSAALVLLSAWTKHTSQGQNQISTPFSHHTVSLSTVSIVSDGTNLLHEHGMHGEKHLPQGLSAQAALKAHALHLLHRIHVDSTIAAGPAVSANKAAPALTAHYISLPHWTVPDAALAMILLLRRINCNLSLGIHRHSIQLDRVDHVAHGTIGWRPPASLTLLGAPTRGFSHAALALSTLAQDELGGLGHVAVTEAQRARRLEQRGMLST